METINHKVAILTSNIHWGNDYDEQDRWLYKHITEWSIVSHEEFKFLQQGVIMANHKHGRTTMLILVEYPNQMDILFETIEEGKKYFKRLEDEKIKYERELMEKQERDKKKRLEKKIIKDAKTLEEKKKLLKELEKPIMAEESKK